MAAQLATSVHEALAGADAAAQAEMVAVAVHAAAEGSGSSGNQESRMKTQTEVEHAIARLDKVFAVAERGGDIYGLIGVVGMLTFARWVTGTDDTGFAEMLAAMDTVDRAERQ